MIYSILRIPYKSNGALREAVEKTRYRLTNWPGCNKSLPQRGEVTIWRSREAETASCAGRRKTRGGETVYLGSGNPDLLEVVYKQLLRQRDGFLRCLFKLIGVECPPASFFTFSRCGSELILVMNSRADADGATQVLVYKLGLKKFDAGE